VNRITLLSSNPLSNELALKLAQITITVVIRASFIKDQDYLQHSYLKHTR